MAKAKLSKAQGHLYYGGQQQGLQPIGSGHVGSCCSCVEWRCWGVSNVQVVAGVRQREPVWPGVLHWHCSKIKVNWKRKEKKRKEKEKNSYRQLESPSFCLHFCPPNIMWVGRAPMALWWLWMAALLALV